jgi:hypothetical protein
MNVPEIVFTSTVDDDLAGAHQAIVTTGVDPLAGGSPH